MTVRTLPYDHHDLLSLRLSLGIRFILDERDVSYLIVEGEPLAVAEAEAEYK